MKRYMVVEHLKPGCIARVYERFEAHGRMLPEGLYYLHSWVNREKNICFQLMETNDEDLFSVWIEKWRDLVDFEVTPID